MGWEWDRKKNGNTQSTGPSEHEIDRDPYKSEIELNVD